MEPSTPPQPAQPLGTRDSTYTREVVPATPINRFPGKKARAEQHFAPAPIAQGAEKRVTYQTAHALQQGIEGLERRVFLKTQLMKELASVVDSWISNLKTSEEQEIADGFSKVVSSALIAQFGGTTSPEPSRASSSPREPRTFASVAASPTRDAKISIQHTKAQRKADQPPPAQSRVDTRILVTLPFEALSPREESFTLRARLIQSFPGLDLSSITMISPTKTGWAIVPRDMEVRDILLGEEAKARVLQAMRGTAISTPETWYTYVVPRVPVAFTGVSLEAGGLQSITVNEILVRQEVLAQTKISPVRVSPSRHMPDTNTHTRSWIISFNREVPPFYLFSQASRSIYIPKKPVLKIHQFGCQGWCNPVKCRRDRCCNNCGAKVSKHEGQYDDNCEHQTKCSNCFGPFKAGHRNCPAAPKRQGDTLIPRPPREIRNIRQRSRQIMQAAQASRTSSPTQADVSPVETFQTPESSSGGAEFSNGEASPSPSALKRARGEAVTRHEQTGTPSPTSAEGRPKRAAAPTKSMNDKRLRDSEWSSKKKAAEEAQARSPNRFSALSPENPTSAEELTFDSEDEDHYMDTQ